MICVSKFQFNGGSNVLVSCSSKTRDVRQGLLEGGEGGRSEGHYELILIYAAVWYSIGYTNSRTKDIWQLFGSAWVAEELSMLTCS